MDFMSLAACFFFYIMNIWAGKVDVIDGVAFFTDEMVMHTVTDVISMFGWANGEFLDDSGI
jgi:hypothetical protein